ncbi:MAG: T9SS type A sorting domain-containing protein [Crocinitomicaceae bacterium]|nr:T9SS type A sorting domain-containing protein [Crocinitomicaceae bacterium]MDG1777394.1 T9SS type A sorting domain-containing protein [Crocinitomicaceae bacterium]
MKRILLLTVLTFIGTYSFAQGQIGNGDMESWANNDEPDNWNSFLTATGTWSSFASDQCDASSDVRPGSLGTTSCKIFSNSILGTVANGNVTLGQIVMGSTNPTSPDNHNKTITGDVDFSESLTDTPDSIVYWVKYTPNGGNGNARMKATLHADYDYRDPEDAASAAQVVATAVDNYPSTQGEWERHAIAFDYTVNPGLFSAYILVTFTTNEIGGQGNGNDVVLIDDVELIYNSNAIAENTDEHISVSINNATNQVCFNSENDLKGTYAVFNTLGQAVQTGNISNQVYLETVPGVYFVHLKTKGRVYTFEVIKN